MKAHLGSDWRLDLEEKQLKSTGLGVHQEGEANSQHVHRAWPTGTQGHWASSQTSFCHTLSPHWKLLIACFSATKVSVSLKINEQPANVNPHKHTSKDWLIFTYMLLLNFY